jgi:hypothetical protein
MISKYIPVILILSLTISFCQPKTSKPQKLVRLSESEILNILDCFEFHEESSQNVHLGYDLYLNDSSFIISFTQNISEPKNISNLLDTMEYKNMDLFIYLNTNDEAFYFPDSWTGKVLINREFGMNVYQEIKILSNYDTTMSIEHQIEIF